jgi:hypothetical protein
MRLGAIIGVRYNTRIFSRNILVRSSLPLLKLGVAVTIGIDFGFYKTDARFETNIAQSPAKSIRDVGRFNRSRSKQ